MRAAGLAGLLARGNRARGLHNPLTPGTRVDGEMVKSSMSEGKKGMAGGDSGTAVEDTLFLIQTRETFQILTAQGFCIFPETIFFQIDLEGFVFRSRDVSCYRINRFLFPSEA